MEQKLKLECALDPRCMDMEVNEFRSFMIDQCIPLCWETMSELSAGYRAIESNMPDAAARGRVNVSCSADSSGNSECQVGASWDF